MKNIGKYELLLSEIRKRVPWISDDEICAISECLSIHSLPTRHFIINAGERVSNLHFVLSGMVKAFYVDDSGDEITVNFMKERRFFTDFYSVTNSLPSRFYFKSIEPVEYISLPFEALNALCDRSHAIERFFRLALGEVFNDWEKRTEDFLFLKAEDRYRKFLSSRSDIAARVSVTDLASYLGIERQSLTRIRKKMLADK